MGTLASNLKSMAGYAHRAGPYLLLEILLPGGTLFALLLFIYRNRRLAAAAPASAARASVVQQAIAAARDGVLRVQPYDIAAIANGDAANDGDGLAPLAMVPGR